MSVELKKKKKGGNLWAGKRILGEGGEYHSELFFLALHVDATRYKVMLEIRCDLTLRIRRALPRQGKRHGMPTHVCQAQESQENTRKKKIEYKKKEKERKIKVIEYMLKV